MRRVGADESCVVTARVRFGSHAVPGVESPGGFATYDTAPMTLREYGEAGGCPFS